MDVSAAQREMREVYADGTIGQGVSALVWAVSAACATWVSARAGAWSLVFGGMLIFPLTQLILVARRRPASVSATNPLKHLATQVAMTVPLTMPLAGAAMLYREAWFYPAFMVIVGAHYLPFAFLYGRRAYLLLGGVLVVAGLGIGWTNTGGFELGGWITAAVLVTFAAMMSLSRRGVAASTTLDLNTET